MTTEAEVPEDVNWICTAELWRVEYENPSFQITVGAQLEQANQIIGGLLHEIYELVSELDTAKGASRKAKL